MKFEALTIYAQDGAGKPRHGFEYLRTQNPTRKALNVDDLLANIIRTLGKA